METSIALLRLSALAQANRLAVFRLLVKAGKSGLAAGEICAAWTSLDTPAILSYWTFIRSACQGDAGICAPLADATDRIACSTPSKGACS